MFVNFLKQIYVIIQRRIQGGLWGLIPLLDQWGGVGLPPPKKKKKCNYVSPYLEDYV